MKNIPNLRGNTKLVERKLRQFIREFYLLMEAALSPSDARRKGIKFKIKDRRQAEYIEILALYRNGTTAGFLSCHKENDPCLGAWSIDGSYAYIDGLGPLMYDLMIDLVHPDSLTSDRVNVSDNAHRVWNYYHDKRPDIRSQQLDDIDAPRTKDPKDDCVQSSARIWSYDMHGTEEMWPESSLSKAYSRADGQTSTLDALLELDLIVYA